MACRGTHDLLLPARLTALHAQDRLERVAWLRYAEDRGRFGVSGVWAVVGYRRHFQRRLIWRESRGK